MKTLAVLGASGHGKVIADTAESLGYRCVFFDDGWPERTYDLPWPVMGNTNSLLKSSAEFSGVVVAIGNNAVRYEKIKLLKKHNVQLPTLIHPSAVVSRYASIAEGSVVLGGVVVNVHAQIGVGAILNTGCSVDHDCVLDHAVHISPGARLAGGVRVGRCAWVGIGAVVKQLTHVGHNSVVGAGAAVVRDVADNTTVIGVPAKTLDR